VKHINPLVDLHKKKLEQNSRSSRTKAGQTKPKSGIAKKKVSEPDADYQSEPELDHATAIARIFAHFQYAYHNQFHKAFPDAEDLVIAKKYWLSNLDQFSPVQILQAARKVIASQDYLPSIASLVKACEEGFDLFGLPSTRQAYLEACSAPSPKRSYDWSHPAVFYAGKAAGWFVLANESEARAMPIFDYHYSLLCKRVMSGEQLDAELPIPLSLEIRISMLSPAFTDTTFTRSLA
jgi:hypothetical protein